MAQCVRDNPGCIKNFPNSNAKFCTACGTATAVALGTSPSPVQNVQPTFSMPVVQNSQNPSQWSSGSLKAGLLADLSLSRQTREPATISSSMQVAGGLSVGLGIILIAMQVESGGYETNTFGGFIVFLLGLAGLWTLAYRVRNFIVGASAAVQLVLPVAVAALFLEKLSNGEIGLPLLIISVLFGVFWVLPGFRARPAFLASAIFWGITAVGILSVQSQLRQGFYLDEFNTDYLTRAASDGALIVMLLGVGLLSAGWNLDRKSWPNIATPFIAVGVYSAAVGGFGYIDNGDFGDAGSLVLIVALSLGLLIVGSSANRRATTWIGTMFLTFGLIGLVIAMVGQDAESSTPYAIFALIIGGLVGFLGNKYGPLIASRIKSSTP
jgi:hypothetical protein